MPFRRTIAILVFIDVYLGTMLLSGCQRVDRQPAPKQVVQPVAAEKPTEAAAGPAECGAGKDCAGQCNQWNAAAVEVQKKVTPADAEWHKLTVQGMRCGGCERRIIANIGTLPGVLGVEADAELGQVRVAVAKGGKQTVDVAAQKIAALGYGVAR